MESREHLGSRLGFIMLSAGCAIGCGNIWKFPWMCGQYGGGSFMFVYLICLLVLGLPVLVMEFSFGRAAQTSPVFMFKKLQKKGSHWSGFGFLSLAGNVCLMAFYCVVTGWIIYYFYRFLTGNIEQLSFGPMLSDPKINVGYLAITVVIAFIILCFKIQKGLERVSKVMMIVLLILLLVLAVRSMLLPGAKEGLAFYLIPDFSKINGEVIVGAMNQAFFTLSLGIGSMAIFGSYIGKDHAIMGEAVTVIVLDTFVAIVAGLIMFPACFSYGLEVTAGPSLLFETMTTVFRGMAGGRWWGTAFFLFMIFAAMSTVLGVCENILAMIRDLTGWSRPKGALICGIGIFLLALTTALGFNLIHFEPFAEGSTFLDLWDFIVSYNLLPLGSLVVAVFCCYRFGWGWENFLQEANTGKGPRVKKWMRPFFSVVAPLAILFIYIYGMVTFPWR